MQPEDPMSAFGRYVGKLERAMYGARDAPMVLQDHLRKTVTHHEVQGVCNPSPGVFQHETRDIILCVHVDDLLWTGLREYLMWLKKQFLEEYELETMLMGEDDDMEKKAVYLVGTLEWSESCVLSPGLAGFGRSSPKPWQF